MTRLNILLVDDDDGEGELLVRWLECATVPARVRQAFTLPEALAEAAAFRPDVVFLDAVLPPYVGPSETLPALRRAGYAGPVIVSSMLTRADMPGGVPDDARVRVVCKDELSPEFLRTLLSG